MTPGWGRKRCPRRLHSPPICVPMPRPCLDSLEIPPLRPHAIHRAPGPRIVPRCVLPSCDTKHPICHCAEKNYCTTETCTNSATCLQSQTLFCPYGIKRDKDEHNVCNGPSRQQEGDERNYIEDFEKYEPTCDEASCEQLENCGVGSTSNDEELISPITYTPSVTNQNDFGRKPPLVARRQLPFNNEIGSLSDRGMTQRSHNFSEINKSSNINRCIQINMQNETISRRGRDAESSIVPEVCCRGNEVPNSFSLSGLFQCKSSIVDKNNVPAPNIHSTFDATRERHDTSSYSNNLYSKPSEFQLNNHVSDVDENGGYSRDYLISPPDENNSNRNKYSYDIPVSFELRSQEQLNFPENGEFVDGLQRSKELSQQNIKKNSEQYENHAKRNPINSTQMQFAPQGSSRTNIDGLRIRDNSQHILAQENDPLNFIPSTILSLNKTSPYISGATQGHLDSFESTCQIPTQYVTPPVTNVQPITSYTNPPIVNNTFKQFSGSKLNQVRFHDNGYINNASYSSNPEKHNQKSDKLWGSSKMQINDNTSKDMNTIQPTNSTVFDDKYRVICEGCKQGCCTHRINETVNKSGLPFYKPAKDVDCVCSKHELENIKCKKKPVCVIEDGTSSCASTTCIVNKHLECGCRYPPAFKQFSCTGNISGMCNCNDKK